MTAFLSGKNFSTITSSDIADSAIVSSKIADDAVTTSKIATDAVTGDALLTSAVVAISPTTDLSPIENRMAVDRLRSLIATNGAYIKSQDGVADEYADETGVEGYTTGYLANSIPTMTGTSAPSGTAIFDSESSPTYSAFKAFDNSASTRWARNSAGQVGWVGYDFGSGNGKIISKMVFTAPTSGNGEMPKTFTIDGWNGSAWVVLETITNASGYSTSETRDYVFTNTTSYQKYRVNVTVSQDGANCTMGELAMHEYVTALSANVTYDAAGDYYHNPPGGSTAASMTLVSKTFTAQTAPTEASLVLLHQPIVACTLNTDILAYISRDNGTTYTQGTLADGGEYSTGINILTINGLDISAQPSGTSMRYKIVTANAKEQRLHGSWIQWS